MPELECGGAILAKIHEKGNQRKREAYWLGFLRGILASSKLEDMEVPSLRAEAEHFLELLGDDDAAEILRDLDTAFDDYNGEVYAAVECIAEQRSRSRVDGGSVDVANEFYGFCAGIACDNRIVPEEVTAVLAEIGRLPSDVAADSRISLLGEAAQRAILDGRVTPEESEDISSWICHLVGDSCADTGLATFGNMPVLDDVVKDVKQIVFEENSFVVTGTFLFAPRKVIKSVIVELGGTVSESVSRKTHYLVFGAEASRDWKYSHEGTKLARARELRQLNGSPLLVDESTFCRALGKWPR